MWSKRLIHFQDDSKHSAESSAENKAMDSEESGSNEVMDTLYDTRFWNEEDASYWKLMIFFKSNYSYAVMLQLSPVPFKNYTLLFTFHSSCLQDSAKSI